METFYHMYKREGEEERESSSNPVRYVNLQQGLVQTHGYWYLWITIRRNSVVVQAAYYILVESITLEKAIEFQSGEAKNRYLCTLPPIEKLNKGGRSLPVDIFVSGLRSSSKKGCTRALLAQGLANGLYCKINDIKSIASGGVLNLNIYRKKKAL